MREGSLEAPTRHRIAWEDPDFADREKTEAEMHRVFDICHTCRRCFNLCDAFPRLFDLIDNSESGELDTVAPADYREVADACTLCDMCFMTKCPYVPPHEFNVDFPHLMLRYRAVEQREGRIPLRQRELVKTDRNGRLAGMVAPLANWASDRNNTLTRPLLEDAAGIDRNAALPKYHGPTFVMRVEALGAAGRPHGAGLRPQGGALRHLLRQLQQSEHRRSDPRRAGPERGRDRGASIRAAAACRNSSRATSPRSRHRRTRSPRLSVPGSTRATTSSRWSRPAR